MIIFIVVFVAALAGGLIYWLAAKKKGSSENYSTGSTQVGGKPCGFKVPGKCGELYNGYCLTTIPGGDPRNGVCKCNQDKSSNGGAFWSGSDCTIGPNKCPECIHGTCDEATGKCKCDDGWIFDNCSFKLIQIQM